MALKLANNAVAILAAALSPTDTSVALNPGAGDLFPTLSAGDWFPATLVKASGAVEVVKVTARNADALTVERAQEGTAALSFSAGDRIEHRLTAGVLNSIIADVLARLPLAGGTITGDLTVGGKHAVGGLMTVGGGLSVTGAITQGGAQVWHTGNFNPANYLPLSGGTITNGILTISHATPYLDLYDQQWGSRKVYHDGGLIGFLTSGGGWACYSQNDGTFIASGNLGAYSDRKHKTDIDTIGGALALIERLRGVRYTDKRTGARRVGVIAQEVQEHMPEVVGEGPDGLHVDYGNMVGPLIEAVKELAGEVRMLKRGL